MEENPQPQLDKISVQPGAKSVNPVLTLVISLPFVKRKINKSQQMWLMLMSLVCLCSHHLPQDLVTKKTWNKIPDTLARKLESKIFLSQASVIHQKKRNEKCNRKIVDFQSVSGPPLELFHFLLFLIVK